MANHLPTENPAYQPAPRFAAKLMLLALVYFACGRLGLAIPYVDSHITLVWLPTGIAVAALLRWGYICWPGIFFGALVTNYSVDSSPLLDCCIALGNTLAPLLAAWLLRRLKFHPAFDDAQDILFLIVAAAIGMLVSASAGVSSLLLFKVLPMQEAGSAWLSWWAGDFIGVLLVAPLLLNISRAELKTLWVQRVEFSVWIIATLAIYGFLFYDSGNELSYSHQLAFIGLPTVVWAAMRFRVMGSSLGVLLPVFIAAIATRSGLGPFYTGDAQQGLFQLWAFFFILVLIELMVAALQSGRKKAEAALQQSEMRFRQMFERHNSIMLLIEPASGEIVDANAAATRFYGYPPERLMSMNIAQINILPPQEIAGERARALHENRNYFIFPHRLASGEMRTVEVHSSPIEMAGHTLLFSIIHDITERKQMELQLAASELQLRTIIETEPECVKLMAEDGTVLQMNAAGLRMLEADTPEQIIGQKALGIVAPQHRHAFAALMRRVFAGESDHLEFEVVGIKGTHRWLETYEVPMRDVQGKITAMLGITRDITERKRDEKILQAAQQHEREALHELRVMLDTSGEGFWKVEISSGYITEVNDAYCHIAGYDRKEIVGAHITKFEAIEPTPEIVAEHIQRVIELGTDRFETRHRHRDGHLVDVEIVASYIQETDCVIAFMHDVSERKHTEERQRIAAVTFETQEAILITDPDARILRVNQAFQDVTGYSSADVVGQNPSMFQSGRHDAVFYQAMWSALLNTGKWSGEVWDKRKDGSIYPKLMTITAVYDDNRQITQYVAVFRDISNRKKSEQEIHQLAFYDPLTMLPNRRLLLDRLQQAMAVSMRNGHHGALLFLDLDHFKTINDTQGHAMGDQLLIEVARRLQNCVREGDSVARLGGDEFVVVLEDLSSEADEAASQTESVAEKIHSELDQPYHLKDFECLSTASIGISLFLGHQESVDDLLMHADVAMYQAKTAGRNIIRFFDPHMQTALDTRTALETDLRHALEKQQFRLHYQIQVDNLRRALGAEALLRWDHPERGLVSPMEFIPLAEETGLIVHIGLWVLQIACAQLKAWQHDASTRDLTLAVNVSAKQFRQANFVAQVQRVLLESGAQPSQLKLELTESTVLENVEDTISKMREIKALGVSFSMDDFGTGYSSLQYLKRLPLNQIKIDRSFVRDISTDPSDAAIVQTIIAMTEALGLHVIAEGVETEAQLYFLDLHGCHAFQGYLFSKPVPIEQFEALLRHD
jgi:diguanylate cyclase (GGDEF)-like protein/PAS domain S-box-containing protein